MRRAAVVALLTVAALVLPDANVDRVLRAVDGLVGAASLAHLLTALRVEDKPA